MFSCLRKTPSYLIESHNNKFLSLALITIYVKYNDEKVAVDFLLTFETGAVVEKNVEEIVVVLEYGLTSVSPMASS